MKIWKPEDVDLTKIYYYKYSNQKRLCMVVPSGIKESNMGENHFWTEAMFYDVVEKKWFDQTGSWIFGNNSYYDTDEKLTPYEKQICFKALFDFKIK